MPDVVPARALSSELPYSPFDPSSIIDLPVPLLESPSQGRLEGNVTGGGERKVVHVPTQGEGLEATLFKNRANLKLQTSQVAMHLSSDERRSLFVAIDRLLNSSEWEDESSEIDEKSFRSYLRFTIYAHPGRVPNMGVSPEGALLAGWHVDGKSVHVEFLPEDQCMVLVRQQSVRGLERIAWRGHVARLREIIENNEAIECID